MRFPLPAHTQRIPNESQNSESTTMAWRVFTFREQWFKMKANSADAICCASAYPAHTQWRPKLGKHDHWLQGRFGSSHWESFGVYLFTLREQWPQMTHESEQRRCVPVPAHTRRIPSQSQNITVPGAYPALPSNAERSHWCAPEQRAHKISN